MNKLTIKIAGGIAGAALITSSIAPVAFAETSGEISDNGANSTNTLTITDVNTLSVAQTNATNATVNLTAKANTGGNKAVGNTGDGDVTIDTGDATVNATVAIGGSSNTATVNLCGCEQLDNGLLITGNGESSSNTATKTKTKTQAAAQTNAGNANVTGKVKAKSGKNKIKNNTGAGAKAITTGAANNTADVAVDGSSNTFTISP